MKKNFILIASLICITSCNTSQKSIGEWNEVSGIYPHLAFYNNEGECGTGAVVPWANKLWVITYGPHLPMGSSDKLYEITPDLEIITRDESIGGTPANRMIHKESNQLFIGPYAINEKGDVRTIPYSIMPGRHTGNARHLSDPSNKIYYGTMEEGIYEVDVNTLNVKELYKDGNFQKKTSNSYAPAGAMLPGVHGKGLYSGQNVLVFSNNGEGTQEALKKFDIEAGVLAEWNGKDWTVIRRNQFTEITGPGGIYGNKNPNSDPIWALGWDHKSVLLGVRDSATGWHFFRLPKASHSYDGAHGWNTEWPRIRNIGTEENPDYLMTMHGMFWRFPKNFTKDNTSGIRPRSAYLKVIGDFARWHNRLVFGCDDSAQKEFLNKRKIKGNIEGAGQSNSNLWFTSISTPDKLGPTTAEASIWRDEIIKSNNYSEPLLFSGWDNRSCWIENKGDKNVTYTLEVDINGNNKWQVLKSINVKPKKSVYIQFCKEDKGEWIRLKTDETTKSTVCFLYRDTDNRTNHPDNIYKGVGNIKDCNIIGGLMYSLGKDKRSLGILANNISNGNVTESGYYEIGKDLKLIKKEDKETASFIRSKFSIPTQVVKIEKGSIVIEDGVKRRWRLPIGNEDFKDNTEKGLLRICREVATERDLFNCMGTFYELPAENADGFAKIRPISTHNFFINDYASYRGMLILTGINQNIYDKNPHIIVSDDKKAAVWAGTIDDLWKLGKPIGKGGPWVDTYVKAYVTSDPYLIGFYDKRTMSLSHKSDKNITLKVEVDPTGNGDWMLYKNYIVKPGETINEIFPDSFEARWIRFTSDTDAQVTTWLEYK